VPGNYIDFYFQSPAIRSLAIPVDLWQVNSTIDQKTGDPFIPLIEKNQNMYRIAGTALFSQNRMVGQLSKDETETLALLRGTDVGYLTIPLGTNQHAAFSSVRSTAKVTPNISPDGSLAFNVAVDSQGALVETFPHREIGWQQKKEIERKAERLLKRDIQSLIAKLQSFNTDPVGFGGKLRIAYPREWQDIDWIQVYPTVDFTVDASFTVRETGLFR
jgi:spore germination protein BC